MYHRVNASVVQWAPPVERCCGVLCIPRDVDDFGVWMGVRVAEFKLLYWCMTFEDSGAFHRVHFFRIFAHILIFVYFACLSKQHSDQRQRQIEFMRGRPRQRQRRDKQRQSQCETETETERDKDRLTEAAQGQRGSNRDNLPIRDRDRLRQRQTAGPTCSRADHRR